MFHTDDNKALIEWPFSPLVEDFSHFANYEDRMDIIKSFTAQALEDLNWMDNSQWSYPN